MKDYVCACSLATAPLAVLGKLPETLGLTDGLATVATTDWLLGRHRLSAMPIDARKEQRFTVENSGPGTITVLANGWSEPLTIQPQDVLLLINESSQKRKGRPCTPEQSTGPLQEVAHNEKEETRKNRMGAAPFSDTAWCVVDGDHQRRRRSYSAVVSGRMLNSRSEIAGRVTSRV